MSDYLKKLEQELLASKAYDPATINLDNCDKEPIHLIGQVQAHGLLLASSLDNDTPLIDYISDNAGTLLGLDVSVVLGKPLSVVIDAASIEMLTQAASAKQHTSHQPHDITLSNTDMDTMTASCHIHAGMLFIEIQPFLAADIPTTTFTDDDKAVMTGFSHALLRNKTFADMSGLLVDYFRAQLGYDRVMVYLFDDDEHGEVVAESKREELESYLGLHYPASDIPQFARYLYVQNRCRMIVNITGEPSHILAAQQGNQEHTLDLRHASLRSMSPIHIEYLSNLGITASLTMSLVRDDRLYGMVIMHHYSPLYCDARARDLVARLSHVCSDYVSVLQHIELTSNAEKSHEVRSLINMYLFDAKQDINYHAIGEALQAVMHADGSMISLNNNVVYHGGIHYAKISEFANKVERYMSRQDELFVTHNIGRDCPDLLQLDNRIAGLMVITIPSDARSFIALFRLEKSKTVTWAGRKQQYQPDADGRLHPRRSFQLWREHVRGTAERWSAADNMHARSIRGSFVRFMLILNERNLARMLAYDTLTGLPNRHLLTQQIDEHLEHGEPISLLFIDCDRFKIINDSLGHDIGDRVLQEVGKKLQRLEDDSITAARLGGDEFTMLVQSTDAASVSALAERVLRAFRQPLSFDRYNFHVPASIGIAMADASSTRSSLMKAADMAMYEAKQAGGNCYQFISARTLDRADERLQIEQNHYEAVLNNEICNYYQPLISAKTGKTEKVEALCRWIDPVHGVISPDRFLAIAEETGIIIPIGIELIRQALADLVSLHAYYPGLALALNFSPLQLLDEVMGDVLIEEARRLHIKPQLICIEITEESYFDDEKVMVERLLALKNAGFSIAIDDFGSGYSSLNYLYNLPADIVKLDRSLIKQITDSQRAHDLVALCRQMADVCELRAVAEGVETEAQCEMLKHIGMDLLQGYYFSKPLPLAELRACLAKQAA